jgi:hypothetical protein
MLKEKGIFNLAVKLYREEDLRSYKEVFNKVDQIKTELLKIENDL